MIELIHGDCLEVMKKIPDYRYTAKPSIVQTYAEFKHETCEWYIECRTKSQKKRLDIQTNEEQCQNSNG